MMYIPNPYFANVPRLGDMFLDYIFMEDGYPLLFTCKANDKLYICICRTMLPKQKWVISETTIDILQKMANCEIPICDAFKLHNGRSCIIYWSKELGHEFDMFPTSELKIEDLPPRRLFLDEDDAEDALNYVAMLKDEAAIKDEHFINALLSSNDASEYINNKFSIQFVSCQHFNAAWYTSSMTKQTESPIIKNKASIKKDAIAEFVVEYPFDLQLTSHSPSNESRVNTDSAA